MIKGVTMIAATRESELCTYVKERRISEDTSLQNDARYASGWHIENDARCYTVLVGCGKDLPTMGSNHTPP